MKKIAIIGSTLSGNKGAAAMLEASIQTITNRYPDAEFTLFSYIPTEQEIAKNTYKNLKIVRATPLYLGVVINSLALLYRLLPPLRPLLKKSTAIDALSEADVLLDQGGITFVDGREKFLLYNVASIFPAMMTKTKIVKCAQALGPFNGRLNRLVAKVFLPRVTLIVARGRITFEYLKALGLKNVVEGADYAFLLKLTEGEKEAVSKHYKAKFFEDSEVVGVSPSVVMRKKVDSAGKDYTKLLVNFINTLAAKNYKVVLLPHSARSETTKTHNNDLPLCREIYAGLKVKESCLFIDKELTSQELRAIIGKCDFFVASRFHAMISSLSMQVPTLVLGWSHKYKEVLEMFGLEEWAFGHDKANSEHLLNSFEKMTSKKKEIKKKLASNLPKVKRRAEIQVREIDKILSS